MRSINVTRRTMTLINWVAMVGKEDGVVMVLGCDDC